MGLSREVPLPFTVSHAAAAWPIRAALGGRVVLSALVVGTLAPDAEYFVHMGPVRTISHTFPGLFLMDLPVGLALLWLFHRLYKRSFALLLPEALAARLLPEAERPFRWGPPGRFLAICASIWAGSATHVLWDAFTHRRSAVEHGWTWLTAPVFRAFGMDFAVHSVLQNLSSVLGLVALALWASRALATRTPWLEAPSVPPQAKAAAWGFILAAGVAVSAPLAWGRRSADLSQAVHDVSVSGVIGLLGGALWASLLVAVAIARLYPASQAERAPGLAAIEVREGERS